MVNDRRPPMRAMVIAITFIICPSLAYPMDVATEHTQILNNIELITENLRQLQSLENQIEMIKNQVEQLKSVANYQDHFNDINALRNNLSAMVGQGTALSGQTQIMVQRMQQQLADLPPGGSMLDQQMALDEGTLDMVQSTLGRVAQIRQSYQQVVDSVNALMDKNNVALGQTQALQTSNQLTAQTIAQNQSTQELLSEQISLQAVFMNKQLREEKAEDDKLKQIFNSAIDGNTSFEGGP